MKSNLSTLKKINLLAGSMGVVLPGASFFINSDYAPPLCKLIWPLASGAGAALLFYAFHQKISRHKALRRGIGLVLVGLVLEIIYFLTLPFLSAGPPPTRTGDRIQVGFHLAEFSLTPAAIEQLHSGNARSVQDLMMAFGAYGDTDKVTEIWYTWSVLLAGLILIILFVGGFVLWCYGFGLLGSMRKIEGGT